MITIIVPVYNAEETLPKCLSSLVYDGVPDAEFILVDDGSTDHSGSICDSFCAENSNARVIHQANGGLSSARNAGFAAVDNLDLDRWVWFVDSDDVIAPGSLSSLDKYTKETDADAIHFECTSFKGTDSPCWGNDLEGCGSIVTGPEFLSGTYSMRFDHYLWLFLFRSTTLNRLERWRENRGLDGLCNEDYSLFEDLVFIEELMQSACRSVLCIPHEFYGYRQSALSMSHVVNPCFADSALRALRYIDRFDVPDSDRRAKELMQIALLFNAYRAAGQDEESVQLRAAICGEIEHRVRLFGVFRLPQRLFVRYVALKSGFGDILLKRRGVSR
ncbi:glycosyltransferase [Collinsella sp. LCP21S3_A3]|uniref:glycosyltransferase n=1 Tax=Collinsella sp. LCP21S3_A3 TaxID=3438769 RepID=UPI003F8FB4DB